MKPRSPVTSKRLLPIASLLFGLSVAQAATIPASSCSQAAVQTAVNAASDGDRVVVPAGTCTWTNAVSISNKTIILEGAGSGAGGTKIVHGGGNIQISVSAGSKERWTSNLVRRGNPTIERTAGQLWGQTGGKISCSSQVFDGNNPGRSRVRLPAVSNRQQYIQGNAYASCSIVTGCRCRTVTLELRTSSSRRQQFVS